MVTDQSWAISWISGGPPGWAWVMHPAVPDELKVTVKMARTKGGLAPEAVLVERMDGRAITARDLRAVKLPPPWMLASSIRRFLPAGDDSPVIAAARKGPRGKGDEHWRAVFSLWSEARRVAPPTHGKWMLRHCPGVA